MIGQADLTQAIVKVWDDNNIDAAFNGFWAVADKTRFMVLLDQEASPGQPFPYCVFDLQAPQSLGRSSGGFDDSRLRDLRSATLTFNIHAKTQGSTSAKRVAASLLDTVVRYYGGHPLYAPQPLVLAHGNVINVKLVTEYSVRTGDDEFQWIAQYEIITDIPEAT